MELLFHCLTKVVKHTACSNSNAWVGYRQVKALPQTPKSTLQSSKSIFNHDPCLAQGIVKCHFGWSQVPSIIKWPHQPILETICRITKDKWGHNYSTNSFAEVNWEEWSCRTCIIQKRVLEDPGIMYLSWPSNAYISEKIIAIHESLNNNWVQFFSIYLVFFVIVGSHYGYMTTINNTNNLRKSC